MRYFISTNKSWFPEGTSLIIKNNIYSNLRNLWQRYSFDYKIIDISCISIVVDNGTNLKDIYKIIKMNEKYNDDIIKNIRFLVSEYKIEDEDQIEENDKSKLLIIGYKSDFDNWEDGGENSHVYISVSEKSSKLRLESAINDVFKDIMIANGSFLSVIINKYIEDGNNISDFYKMKADYASNFIKINGKPSLFPNYNPNKYASFSTISRNDISPGPKGIDLNKLANHWESFLFKYLSNYFLTPTEAINFILDTPFRRASSKKRDAIGQNSSRRIHFGDLSRHSLQQLLSDPQNVPETGSYVLMILTRKPKSGEVDAIGALMGWSDSSEKKVRKLKLIKSDVYHKFSQHVSNGALTPVRLFLKTGET